MNTSTMQEASRRCKSMAGYMGKKSVTQDGAPPLFSWAKWEWQGLTFTVHWPPENYPAQGITIPVW